MRTLTILLLSILTITLTGIPSPAEVKTESVVYEINGDKFEGYLAWNDEVPGKRPGVLIVHEWWGLTEHPKNSARKLAELGYVAFALDMYGQGKVTDSADQAGKWAREIYSAPAEKGKVRFDAGLEQLRSHTRVDPTRIAAIGYCFGGSVVLEMARLGADVKGVVSFHGGLDSSVPEEKKDIKASVLVCTGASDQMVPPEQVKAFGEEMTALGADWYLVEYGGAVHSFTNPAAAERGMSNVDYDPKAAARSWRAMLDFFTELFAE